MTDPLTPEQAKRVWDELAAGKGGESVATPAGATDFPAPEAPAAAAPAAEAPATPQEPAQGSGAPAPADPPADPAAGAPAPGAEPAPAAKQPTIEEVMAELQAMRREVRSANGRASKAQEAYAALETKLAQMQQAPQQPQPTQAQIDAAGEDDEDWKNLKESFPEWARAIEKRFGTRGAAGDPEAIRSVEKKAAEEIAAVRKEESAARRELIHDFVEMHHEGWTATVNSPQFADWLEKQPTEVYRLAESPKPSDAVRMLNLFKYGDPNGPRVSPPPQQQTAAEIAAARAGRLQASTLQPRASGGKPPAISDENLSPAELWDRVAKEREHLWRK